MLISGPATLSGNTVTLTGTAGTVKIRAYYEGDYNQRGVYQDRTFTVNNPIIPITADEIIYGDALSANWQNFSTAASLTINNATPQFLNTHSIKINNPANNETLDFRYAGLPFNRTDFPDGLDFWVYNDGNSSFPLQVQSFTSSSGGASNNVNVLAESKKWTHVLLEWSLFGNPAQIGKILIRFNQSQSESLFFDEIRLVHCGDMYSTKTGNWNDQTVWSCGRLPVMTDIIRIEQPHNVTVLSGTTATIRLLQLLGTITVQPNGVLDIKDF
ncbi:MAG: hypothetical protein MUF58_20815 [Arcicella sp.]|nr:hypothetical protein [Arcicella sp.]